MRESLVVTTELDAIWTVAVILAAGATLACVLAVATSALLAHR